MDLHRPARRVCGGQRYDLILDNGDRSLPDLRRALARKGTLVVSGGSPSRWIDGLCRANKARALSPLASQRLRPFLTRWSRQDPLSQAAEALAYYGQGHTRGKVAITV